MTGLWLIRRRRDQAWWRQGRQGYAEAVSGAGLFTEAEAREIIGDAWPAGNEHSEPVVASAEIMAVTEHELCDLKLRALADRFAYLVLRRARRARSGTQRGLPPHG